jgi:hypothetical protein
VDHRIRQVVFRQRLAEHDLTDAVVHVSLSGDGDPVEPARIESYATEAGALGAVGAWCWRP